MTTSDQELQELYARIARSTGKTAEEIAVMSREELLEHATQTSFRVLALDVVTRNLDRLFNDGADEQTDQAVQVLQRFHAVTPLLPVHDVVIDLAGFGEAPVRFAHFDRTDTLAEQYLLLSDLAEAVGMPIWKACEWARLQYQYAVEDQRQLDEDRGDGRLGYDCMRDYIDLGFDFIADDPEAKPDANGRRWSQYGDWLISQGRLPWFLCCSPWGKEFIDNAKEHMAIGMRKVFGETLKNAKTYDADGTPTGGNAYDDLFRTGDLSEEEALRKARRGPSGPLADD